MKYLILIFFCFQIHAKTYLVPCEHNKDELCKIQAKGFTPPNVIMEVPQELASEDQDVLKVEETEHPECDSLVEKGLNLFRENKACDMPPVKIVKVNMEKKAEKEAERKTKESVQKAAQERKNAAKERLKSVDIDKITTVKDLKAVVKDILEAQE